MRKLLATAALAAAVAACAPVLPPGPMPMSVAGTNWRVVAINGRATPPAGQFFMNFEQIRFGAKFGCNGLGADYVQRGSIIDPGVVIATRMACPDMSYEYQGTTVLQQDMLATWSGRAALRLSNRGGTIDLRR